MQFRGNLLPLVDGFRTIDWGEIRENLENFRENMGICLDF